jgi:hypothetical protein
LTVLAVIGLIGWVRADLPDSGSSARILLKHPGRVRLGTGRRVRMIR